MADFPPCDDVCGALAAHVHRFFGDRQVDVLTWDAGPITEVNPHFRVLRVAPAPRDDLWCYVSVGAWAATAGQQRGLEFVLTAAAASPRMVELLAMVSYYHEGGRLGLGHTMPIGEPWLPGSSCDHLLVSVPYPFGPDLETCHVGDRHVTFAWLLPVTRAERDFKVTHGLEALERRFEEARLAYWDPARASVV